MKEKLLEKLPDLIILVFILAALYSVWAFLSASPTRAQEVSLSYMVIIENMPEGFFELVEIGAQAYSGSSEVGRITNIEIKEYQTHIFDYNREEFILVPVPYRETAVLTLETLAQTNDFQTLADGVIIGVLREIELQTASFTAAGQIIGISR